MDSEDDPLLDDFYQPLPPNEEATSSPEKPSFTPKTVPFVWFLGVMAAIGGFLFGYDTGVVSGAMLWIPGALKLTYVEQELVISVMLGFCAIFAGLAGPTNDRFGRRPTIMAASFAFTIGAIVLAFSFSFWQLCIGRSIVGAAVGFASMSVPPYIAESCPSHIRGTMILGFQLMITFGQFVASVFGGLFSMNWACPETVGWRLMLGLSGIPSLLQFIGFFFLPESPRWLIEKNQRQRAREVLSNMYSETDKEWREYEMSEIVHQFTENERERAAQGIDKQWTILTILKTPHVRRALFLGCSLQAFQQFAGINTIMYYAATIIQMSGVRDKNLVAWLNTAVAGVNCIFTFIPIFLIARVGRRRILLGSNLGVVVTLVLLGAGFVVIRDTSPTVANQLDLSQYDLTKSQFKTAKFCAGLSMCDDCATWEHCGFCFEKNHTSDTKYGYCLPVELGVSANSLIGPCETVTDQSAFSWAWNYCQSPLSWLVLIAMVLYLIAFTSGMGPMPWLINAEIYPNWARSTGVSLATSTNWTVNLIISQTFLNLTESLHKFGAFFFYAGISTVGLILFYIITPETKDLQIDEVENLFKRTSDRKVGPTSLNNETSQPKKVGDYETEF